ncbi:MAG TPA: omptin family outer membrane protease [Desulfomonilaceae bacterium]|nr:omptin family outer membrane protease [Desulfomonilaceae bacterium]
MLARGFTLIVVCLLVLATLRLAGGENFAIVLDGSLAAPVTTPHFLPSVGIKKFLNSFTSYEFPNPFAPQQNPLSRLEFPVDQWFLGVKQAYKAQTWSLTGEFWINVNRESSLKMQDSDWDDDLIPVQKTVFSESDCRLNRGLMFDVGVTLPTPLTVSSYLRPVAGWRYQHFFFTTHDGYQAELGNGGSSLPGDGIDFKQTFSQCYIGGTLQTSFNPPVLREFVPPASVGLQCDYAIVNAVNEDLHLWRIGHRVTTEQTLGHCWHVSANVGWMRAGSFTARFEVDFKRLITHGDHRLSNLALDFSFGGARVWSDQASVSAFAEYLF